MRLIALIARKLVSAGALSIHRKKILCRLTPPGRELFEAHRAFDEQMERGFIQFLRCYSADELRLLARVLHAADASFLSLGSQAALEEQ